MYRIIDGHAHIYPQKIAARAAEAITAFYGLDENAERFDGTPETLLQLGEANGVTRFLVHSVATSPSQVQRINDFLARECRLREGKFIGFAALHPDSVQPGDELARAKSLGLMGVKLHPDFQQFAISDPKMDEAYEAMQALGLPVLFHTGDPRYDWSSPRHVPVILRKFPRLRVICAHMGGWSRWEEAAECLKGLDLWVDLSSTQNYLPPEAVRHYIELYGTDRVIFGSDYPMWNVKDDIRRFLALGFDEKTNQKIFAENLENLLNLKAEP